MSKRHLGIILSIGSAVGILMVLVYDQLGASDPSGGFGPSQQIGLAVSVLVGVVGLSLLPLGNQPA